MSELHSTVWVLTDGHSELEHLVVVNVFSVNLPGRIETTKKIHTFFFGLSEGNAVHFER